MAKPKRGDEDVLSLLDSLGDTATTDTRPQDTAQSQNEKELFGFLDDLVKQPSRTQTPRPAAPRSGRESATSPLKKTPEKAVVADVPAVTVEESPTQKGDGGGWFGGLWNIGSAAMKTAEQKVKELQQTDEAKAWEERVRGNVSVLGKLGIYSFHLILSVPHLTCHAGNDLRARTLPSLSSTLSSVLNTIAPPIEKHEGSSVMSPDDV